MSAAAIAAAQAAFVKQFGCDPSGVAFAPGRVNLIGEHVDYNDGLVLPMPVQQGTAVAWGPGEDSQIHAFAADFSAHDSFDPAAPQNPADPDWRSYVRGMAAQWLSPLPGIRLAISGDLPRGSGLSSSASLCIALGRAFAAASGTTQHSRTLALMALRTEHDYAGVACGIMDQMAVAAGQPGHAMLLDCRDLSFDLRAIPKDWAIMVVDSGVTRGLVDGEYNARRAQCEAAAEALGVMSLRDVTAEQLAQAQLPQGAAKRAAHVVGEIARVNRAHQAMAAGDLKGFGATLREGHASLRDLFEVSVSEVDALVAKVDHFVGTEGGARMTGAGFGGSVVVVMRRGREAALREVLGAPVTQVY
ncbi:galactokinase [Qipengyuania marisflavi]|uniref:Galactokinase n=1 Tax=Qipengyuania marisflavi TaxID=2486356 RepID=A0A5S3P0A8_9SPHN|nr:galactokinase [Qipengyuania marisflavi]TMM46255.1 galactokinase [Qipengyuania marisflavi]